MIERAPCGCVSDDRSFVPTARHPQLGMCETHRAAWQEVHDRAAREHLGTGPLEPDDVREKREFKAREAAADLADLMPDHLP